MSRAGTAVAAQKCVWPVGPSYAAPSTVTPEPLRDPTRSGVQPSGSGAPAGERRDQGVVVAAGEDEPQRVGPERGADGLQRLGDLEGAAADVDRDPAGLGDVAEVGEQPVGHVDHRRSPRAPRPPRPAPYGGSGRR